MARTNLQGYLAEVKKQFSVDWIFPRITQEEIDYNLEMMPTDNEDAAKMFLAGIITGPYLARVLLGKAMLPFRKHIKKRGG